MLAPALAGQPLQGPGQGGVAKGLSGLHQPALGSEQPLADFALQQDGPQQGHGPGLEGAQFHALAQHSAGRLDDLSQGQAAPLLQGRAQPWDGAGHCRGSRADVKALDGGAEVQVHAEEVHGIGRVHAQAWGVGEEVADQYLACFGGAVEQGAATAQAGERGFTSGHGKAGAYRGVHGVSAIF